MRINEIYPALNGEGINAGIPVTIVRTQGCNMACRWCDSKYTLDNKEGVPMSVDSIMLKSRWPSWAMITGGEPLLQGDLHDLVKALKAKDVKVEIETNGSIEPPAWYAEVDCWCADIKCPSSGVCGQSKLSWLGARKQDQIKFVVTDQKDLEFAQKTFMYAYRLAPTILISPVWPWTNQWLRECVKFCKQYGTRLSLQIHKIIYQNERGV